MKNLKIILPVALILGLIAYNISQKSKVNQAFIASAFHGKVIGIGQSHDTSNKSMEALAWTVTVQGADGQKHEWRTSELCAGYFEYEDYLVKFAGKEYPAVFRKGKQLKGNGVPFYLEEPVDLAAIMQKPTP